MSLFGICMNSLLAQAKRTLWSGTVCFCTATGGHSAKGPQTDKHKGLIFGMPFAGPESAWPDKRCFECV